MISVRNRVPMGFAIALALVAVSAGRIAGTVPGDGGETEHIALQSSDLVPETMTALPLLQDAPANAPTVVSIEPAAPAREEPGKTGRFIFDGPHDPAITVRVAAVRPDLHPRLPRDTPSTSP